MLEIRPIENAHEKEALSARAHVDYRRDALLYAAFRAEVPLAIASFRCAEDLTEIYAVSPCDEGADDGSVPARLVLLGAIAYAAENGCTRFRFDAQIPPTLPEALGLRRLRDGVYAFW